MEAVCPRLVPLLSVAAALLILVLYSIPTLGPEQRAGWSQTGLFGLVLLALALRWWRTRGRSEERWFWLLGGLAFAQWLGAELLIVSGLLDGQGVLLKAVADVLFASSYLAIAAASEMRPDLRPGWSRSSVTLRSSLAGTALLCLGVLAYFVLVAASHSDEPYASLTPSYVMITCLDVLVLGRFLFLARVTSSPLWSRVYGLWAVAGTCWLAGDVMDLLWRAGVWSPPLGTPLDFVYYIPFFAVVASTHPRGMPVVEPGGSRPSTRDRGTAVESSGLLLAYAFAFPVIHLVVEATGILSDEGRIARDVIILTMLFGMVGLASFQQRAIGRRNRELESEITVLATNEQMLQAQKMEALGRLAGGVAHDFNNVLMVIRGSAEMLMREAQSGDRRSEFANSILGAADRASALTRQLLAFGRKEEHEPVVLDLGEEVVASLGMLRRLIGEDVEVEPVIQSRDGLVEADPTRINQVLLNLAANARDAMPQGGKLTLEVVDRVVGEHAGEVDVPPGRYVALRAIDEGKGMDAATRERIFEPFFTTRSEGVGLGLATVYGIVKQSGGTIQVASEPGRGTTVEILLPAVEGAASAPIAPPPEEAAGGSETVLVAEDDGEIRDLVRIHLDRLGYRVLVAEDGRRAISIADSHEEPIDLLITDVQMPACSGSEVARHVRSRHPSARVLYISGHHENELVRREVLERDVWLIPKPFSLDRLAHDVRGALRGERC